MFAERGGDAGIRMTYELESVVPNRDERMALMRLQAGEISDIIRTDDGWLFFRAETSPRFADTNDVTMLGKIRSYMMTFERGQIENFFIRQAEEFSALAREYDFDTAIEEKEMTKRSFGPVPINYGNSEIFTSLSSSSVAEIRNAEFLESFWQTAFSTPVGSLSEPLVIGNNIIVLYPTEERDDDDLNMMYREQAYTDQFAPSFVNQNIRDFFMNSPKLDNRFYESYFKYLY
jgi:hypothetical protein